jgi:endogenous inhibitor of DNA gyrase (YacG/DUF329 family)
MSSIRIQVECPLCERLIDVQVHPATAASASANEPSEVYERCPKCGRVFPLRIPVGLK